MAEHVPLGHDTQRCGSDPLRVATAATSTLTIDVSYISSNLQREIVAGSPIQCTYLDELGAVSYGRVVVDRSSRVWPYRQIADDIAARIAARDLAPEQPIPSETELCTVFGVARGTARHAVAALRDLGLVVTVPQRGTFVARQDGGTDRAT